MPISPKKYLGISSQDTPIIRYVNVPEKVYHASLWNLLGRVDGEGNLLLPEVGEEVFFEGVKNIPAYETVNGANPFYHWLRRFAVKNVKFPDLISIEGLLDYSFDGNPYIESLECPKLSIISGSMSEAFRACGNLKSINFNSLKFVCAPMYYTFGETKISSVSLPELIEINNPNGAGMRSTFEGCSLITSLSAPKLKYIRSRSDYVFGGCGLTSVNLPELEEISGMRAATGAFYGNQIVSVSLPKLKTISGDRAVGYMFSANPDLESVDISAVETITGNYTCEYMFNGNTSLQVLSFNSLRSVEKQTAFSNMLSGCSNVTVHFPSNLQSVIGEWSDVLNGFGGTNTTVLFDLLATE